MRRWMSFLLALAVCLGAAAGALGEINPDELGRFVVEGGVVYWVGEAYAAIATLLDGQESIRVKAEVEGLPVIKDDYLYNPFRTNGARELILEKNEGAELSFGISRWPNLERLVFEGEQWDLWTVSISDCPSLTELILPSRAESDYYSADLYMDYCTKLRSLDIPYGYGTPETSFTGFDALETVTITSQNYFDASLYICMPRLRRVDVQPASNPKLYSVDGVVYNRENQILKLYPSAHEGDTFAVPEGIKKIDYTAFWETPNLKRITLPATVEEAQSLEYPKNLEAIEVDARNPWYKSVDGVLLTKDGQTLVAYPAGKRDAAYAVPATVRTVDWRAFMGCGFLRTLILPEGYTKLEGMGYNASIEEVYLPASLRDIQAGAFSNLSNLRAIHVAEGNTAYQSIDGALFTRDGKELLCLPRSFGPEYSVPEGTERMNEHALYYNQTLTRLVLPKTLRELPPDIFSSCGALKSIRVAEGNPSFADVDGVLFDAARETLLQFPCAHGTYYEVPGGTKVIGRHAFAGNTRLQSVRFASTVETIGIGAFSGCTELGDLSLPLSLQSVHEYAFSNCNALERLVLPKGLTTFRDNAIEGCHALREIWLPPDVPFMSTEPYRWVYSGRTLVVDEGSNAQRWAERNRFSFRLSNEPTSDATSVRQAAILLAATPGESIALHQTAGNTSPVVATHPAGTGVLVAERADAFARVMVGSETGYVPLANLVMMPEAYSEHVSTRGVLRRDATLLSASSRSSQPLLSGLAGEAVDILGMLGGWYKVRLRGAEGYLPVWDVEPKDGPESYDGMYAIVAQADEAQPLDFRAYPTGDAPLLDRYYSGTPLTAIRAAKDWVYVRTMDGQYGFVPADGVLILMLDPFPGNG